MIICCEQCNTKFNVPDNAIGKQGRAVRCSKCSHEWIAYSHNSPKVKPAKTVGTLQPLRKEVAVPKTEAVYTPLKRHLIKTKRQKSLALQLPFYARPPINFLAKTAAIASILFFFGTFMFYYYSEVINKFPWMEKPYSLVGLYNNQALKLEVVNCTIKSLHQSSNTSGTEVDVKVSIANTSNKDQILPRVRFTVFDLNKKFVGELTLPMNVLIPAGGSSKVEGRLNNVPKNSFFVGIDIGDKFDILMHDPARLFWFLHS